MNSLARKLATFDLVAGVATFLGVFLLWPLAASLRDAVVDRNGPTTAYFGAVLASPVYLEGFVHALAIGVASTTLALLGGLSLALAFDRWTFPGKRLMTALVPMPLVVPPFVGAIGIKQLLGQAGALNALLVRLHLLAAAHPIDWLRTSRFWSVVVLITFHLYPIAFLSLSASLQSLNPELDEAAENLGCSLPRRLLRITLPLVAPSLIASGTLIFLSASTELGVPLMCDYTRVTSVQILSGLSTAYTAPAVYVLVTAVIAFALVAFAVSRVLLIFLPPRTLTRRTLHRPSRPLAGWRGAMCAASVTSVVLVTTIPNAGVVLVSLSGDWYRTVLPAGLTTVHFQHALGNAMVLPSIANSLRYVSLATAIDLLLGLTIAHLVTRAKVPGIGVLDALAMLPLVLPGLVMAFGYLAMSRPGQPLSLLGRAGDPTGLIVVAYATRRLPFVVRAATTGLSSMDVSLEEAARNLGATALGTWRRVTIPLVAAHLFAGAVLAFSLSMLDVSDSLVLAQRPGTFPITKAIYELSSLLGEGPWLAAALGVWAMVFLAASIAVARAVAQGSSGRAFH